MRWYDPDGQARMKTVRRKVDAEATRTELEEKLGNGTYRDPSAGRTKFAEIAEEWFTAKLNVKRSTRARYRIALDTYVIPKWGSTPVARIQFDGIAKWLSDILADSVSNGKPLSASTIRKIHVVLKGVLDYAVRARRIAYNPAIGIPLPRYVPPEHVYLDNVQVENLADACGEYRTLILFLAYTGVRWGEATAIKISRVNLATRRVRIAETWSRDKGGLYLDTPKNHERRSVPVPAFLLKELELLMAGRDPDDLLFTAPEGGKLIVGNFTRRRFKKALESAGLADLGITLHKLRHTAASLAIASGADVKVVQTMLGHKTATLTLDTYGHLWPDRLDEVSDRLDSQRSKVLKLAKKKAEKAQKKAAKLAAEVAALEAAADAAAA
ncbi:tyrosine-type recombinase/integrase [Kitasatospora sp. NPDC006786]|uniref:tyrosine-type recombinase/integrase n=3 Tax=Kitasatospora TaxID=2063 RepID=UPI0033D0037D